MNPLIFVVGATGVGKSAWAVQYAHEHGSVILNCDSVQAYQGLNIGAAKPTAADRSLVPHFLFDIVKPGDVLTAGDYRRDALPILARELPKHPVFAVGGSGFYIQALEKGMFEVGKVDPAVEERLRERFGQTPLKALHEELSRLDPESGEELNPNDSYRIQRALIVIHGLGKKLSDLKREFKPEKLPYKIIKIGFRSDRDELKKRIEHRTQAMLAAGWVAEVQGLLDRGLAEWPILQSVGYKQVLEHLRGELPEDKLVDEIVLRTVQLSKRQTTWFQRDKAIHWCSNAEEATAYLNSILG